MARVDVVMPKMGESVMEGTVLEWKKQVGDTIEQDETLLEISTDKVDSEVPSPAKGILAEILVPEGETVEVGAKIALIATGEGASVGSAPAPAAPKPDAAPTGGDGAAPRVETADKTDVVVPRIRRQRRTRRDRHVEAQNRHLQLLRKL